MKNNFFKKKTKNTKLLIQKYIKINFLFYTKFPIRNPKFNKLMVNKFQIGFNIEIIQDDIELNKLINNYFIMHIQTEYYIDNKLIKVIICSLSEFNFILEKLIFDIENKIELYNLNELLVSKLLELCYLCNKYPFYNLIEHRYLDSLRYTIYNSTGTILDLPYRSIASLVSYNDYEIKDLKDLNFINLFLETQIHDNTLYTEYPFIHILCNSGESYVMDNYMITKISLYDYLHSISTICNLDSKYNFLITQVENLLPSYILNNLSITQIIDKLIKETKLSNINESNKLVLDEILEDKILPNN